VITGYEPLDANLNFFENKKQIPLDPVPSIITTAEDFRIEYPFWYCLFRSEFHRHTRSGIETIEGKMSAPSMKPLNETNYEEWALAAMAYLQNTGYWGYVEGIELPPLKPFPPTTTGTAMSTTTVAPNIPESNDPTYLSQFYRYYERYQQYTSNLVKASGAIHTLLDPALQRKYADTAYTTDPKRLWEDIKKERERVFSIDGRQLRELLTSI